MKDQYYYVFAFADYYPQGGIYDLMGTFKTQADAEATVDEYVQMANFSIYTIVDGQFINTGYIRDEERRREVWKARPRSTIGTGSGGASNGLGLIVVEPDDVKTVVVGGES